MPVRRPVLVTSIVATATVPGAVLRLTWSGPYRKVVYDRPAPNG